MRTFVTALLATVVAVGVILPVVNPFLTNILKGNGNGNGGSQ